MMNEVINALEILAKSDTAFLIFISTTLCLLVAGLSLYVVLKVVTNQSKEGKNQ